MLLNRRRFVAHASVAGFGTLFANRLRPVLAGVTPKGPFRRCLVLWMEGGPSQQDTFDPKSRGPRQSVKTSLADVRFAETLSRLAQRADELALVRSVGSREGEHTRATELLHTGFSPIPAFPRPSLGSMISNDRKEQGFPNYVTLGGTGFGPAFLENQHGPFVVDDIEAARRQLQRVTQKRGAMEMLTRLNESYSSKTRGPEIDARSGQIDSVRRLLTTAFPEALDLNRAGDQERSRYGDHEFGRRVLTARRLLTLGVPFVEAQLGGWDTHLDNQRRTEQLCRQLEQPWLALMDDLQRSGLWDDTLIVWMGEFGRTPRLNGQAGRDHFPEITPVVMAGGNLGGRVVGRTSDDGSQRVGPTHTVADLMATVLTLLGLDIEATYTTSFDSPTTLTDDGTPIGELL